MKSTHLKPRLSYLESLSILSSFAVVMLHANGVVHTINPNSGRLWFTSNIIETVFYFAVPCFFMITGVTLFDYSDKYDDKTFFCKRMRKTVIPFLIL